MNAIHTRRKFRVFMLSKAGFQGQHDTHIDVWATLDADDATLERLAREALKLTDLRGAKDWRFERADVI